MTKRYAIEPSLPLKRLLPAYPRIARLILAAAVCIALSVSAIAQKKPSLLVPVTALTKSPAGKTLKIAQIMVERDAGKPTGIITLVMKTAGADKDADFKMSQAFDSLEISFFAKQGTKWALCGKYLLTNLFVGRIHTFRDDILVPFMYQKIVWTSSLGVKRPKDNWLATGG